MAKNLDKTSKVPNDKRPKKHGIYTYKKLDWKDEDTLTSFMINGLDEEEQNRVKSYIKTLVEDESLSLSNFEIKRIAVAMLALDRGDEWFFKNADERNWHELSIELQKFLQGKENMVIDTLRKARLTDKKPKSLFDQLSDEFKSFEVKGEGQVEGVEYTFEAKKKTKPKMLQVVVNEEEAEEASNEESSDDKED